MRNGLNIAAVSELVHEVQQFPVEAHYRYGAFARYRTDRGITGGNLPAVLGTVKSPRDFAFRVGRTADPTPDREANDPASDDLLAVGLAACALTTFVGGASARGITLEDLELRLTVPDGAEHARYAIDARGVTGGVDLAEIAAAMEVQSPNHRTVKDAQTVLLDLPGGTGPAPLAQPSGLRANQVTVRWQYGSQFTGDFEQRRRIPAVRIDQPRQMAGSDWGPNPQEYLLAALAASVLEHTAALAEARGWGHVEWESRASGRVDIRGLFRVDPDVPVRVQDLAVGAAPVGAAPDGWADLVREAASHSEVLWWLQRPHRLDVDLAAQDTGSPAEAARLAAAEAASDS